ncbi:hypothetical protein SpCBS45565_g06591 [Spizellomyces sp. 'palustris']|nr:hypothetical protein SpCBS45565_g08114 [Spizellomyces sp. 'palustris']TPX63466.1 hypothetical protein SpCBS45565_g06591 [Spizellomyces sp. 'palustris']
MLAIHPPKSRTSGIYLQHLNNLRHVLRTALFDLQGEPEKSAEQYSLAYDAAKVLLERPSIQGRKDENASSSAFELMWKVGAELLRSVAPYRAQLEAEEGEHNGLLLHGDGYPHILMQVHEDKRDEAVRAAKKLLRFLAQMSGIDAKLDPELLLEMTLYHMRFGMLEEAYNRLQGYISTYPYNENAVLIGYAGVLSYILWRREAVRLQNERDIDSHWSSSQWENQWDHSQSSGNEWSQNRSEEKTEDLSTAQEGDLASRFYSQGLQHFEVSLFLDKTCDMFLFYYVKLLLAAGDHDTATQKLTQFIQNNPDHPNGYRYADVFDKLKHIFVNLTLTGSTKSYLLQLHLKNCRMPSEWIPLAYKIMQLDPVCDPRIALEPLIHHHEAAADTNAAISSHIMVEASLSVINLLADRLDYEEGKGWMWDKLAKHIQCVRRLDAMADALVWEDRRHWWPRFHFVSLRSPHDGYHLESEQQALVAMKAICALYIFPDEYARLCWPQRFGLTPDTLNGASTSMLHRHGIPMDLFFGAMGRTSPLRFLGNSDRVGTQSDKNNAADVEDVVSLLIAGDRLRNDHGPGVGRDGGSSINPEDSSSRDNSHRSHGAEQNTSCNDKDAHGIVRTEKEELPSLEGDLAQVQHDSNQHSTVAEAVAFPEPPEGSSSVLEVLAAGAGRGGDNLEQPQLPVRGSKRKRDRDHSDDDTHDVLNTIMEPRQIGLAGVTSTSPLSPGAPIKKRAKRVKGF